MNLIQMKCNNCNAQLDLDLDNLQAICPYCGAKLLFDFEQLGQVLREKERTKQKKLEEEEQTKRIQMEYDEKKRKNKEENRFMVIFFPTLLLLIALLFYAGSQSDKKTETEHDQTVSYLQEIESEVEEYIKTQDYDMALFTANKLRGDDDLSSKETKAWDAKREAYIELIQEKKREQEINDPNNIFMPVDATTLKGVNYNDVINELKDAGFTNITAQKTSVTKGLFDMKNTVEHILVGDQSEFTVEDYFNKDTPIIIYYYG